MNSIADRLQHLALLAGQEGEADEFSLDLFANSSSSQLKKSCGIDPRGLAVLLKGGFDFAEADLRRVFARTLPDVED